MQVWADLVLARRGKWSKKLSYGKVFQPQVCGSHLIGKELRNSENEALGTTQWLPEELRIVGHLPLGQCHVKTLQTGLSGQLRVDSSCGVRMECVVFCEYSSSIESTITNTNVCHFSIEGIMNFFKSSQHSCPKAGPIDNPSVTIARYLDLKIKNM